MTSRRRVLTVVLGMALALATFVLHDVWGVVLFAITVAYVLVPLQTRLVDRGLSRWWASTISTLAGTVAALLPFVLAGYLGYRRRDSIIDFLENAPEEIAIDVFGAPYVVDLTVFPAGAEEYLSSLALSIASSLPELGLEATLFAFVLFGLLTSHRAVEDALLQAVPREYRDVAGSLARRAEETLYGIYVLQAATGAATFAIAVVVFWGLGYEIPLTLAFLSGILQFVPIVGPSILIAVLAIYHVSIGEIGAAIAVVAIAGFFVAWLPDVLVRPRLAKRTGNLDGTLYFIGFVGGLLTVGPIGVVIGPLAVALVSEAMSLLGAENFSE